MKRALVVGALLLAAALLAPVAAAALDGAQAEFRSKVEPICAANGRAAERILSSPGRVEAKKARSNGLADSGRHFLRASQALGKAVAKLRAVPRPEADAARLTEWIGKVSDQATLLRQAGKAAIDGSAKKAQRLINQTATGSRRANATVISYEFRHCVLKTAGFTS
jgi:hypothetical protein